MEIKKPFPIRSESRSKYVAWILFAIVFSAYGVSQLMHGNEFVGLAMWIGGVAMAVRETALRMKAKKWAREHGVNS